MSILLLESYLVQASTGITRERLDPWVNDWAVIIEHNDGCSGATTSNQCTSRIFWRKSRKVHGTSHSDLGTCVSVARDRRGGLGDSISDWILLLRRT